MTSAFVQTANIIANYKITYITGKYANVSETYFSVVSNAIVSHIKVPTLSVNHQVGSLSPDQDDSHLNKVSS